MCTQKNPPLCANTRQLAGALQEAQVLGQDGRELRHPGGPSAGEVAGLQDHHARREQGKPHELHRQRAGKVASSPHFLNKLKPSNDGMWSRGIPCVDAGEANVIF